MVKSNVDEAQSEWSLEEGIEKGNIRDALRKSMKRFLLIISSLDRSDKNFVNYQKSFHKCEAQYRQLQMEMWQTHYKHINNLTANFQTRYPYISSDDMLSQAQFTSFYAWEKWNVNRGSKFSTYLFVALKNAFQGNNIKFFKNPLSYSESLDAVFEEDGESRYSFFNNNSMPTLTSDICFRESQAYLARALTTLSIHQREVLSYSFGLLGKTEQTDESIAQRIGKTRNGVIYIRNEAINNLRNFFSRALKTPHLDDLLEFS